jgi:Lrp/AsnC family transcriptional regulator, regulator for asnA, asnC and gidA
MTPEQPPALDAMDMRILLELQEDGRRSYREIAKRLGVTAATVRARVLALLEENVVEVVAVPNPWRLGLGFFAVVALHAAPGSVAELAEALAGRPEVTWVASMATGPEVMCEIALEDAQVFAEYRDTVLAELPGVVAIDVFLQAKVHKLRYRLGDPDDVSHTALPPAVRLARPDDLPS